jgi:hypothetical protein
MTILTVISFHPSYIDTMYLEVIDKISISKKWRQSVPNNILLSFIGGNTIEQWLMLSPFMLYVSRFVSTVRLYVL